MHESTVHGRKVKKLRLGKKKKTILKYKRASGKHKTRFPNAPLVPRKVPTCLKVQR